MNNISHTHGFLEIILGPMFAGKTSRLIEITKQFMYCGIETCIINHSFDIRYETTETPKNEYIHTHDNRVAKCNKFVSSLSNLIDDEDIKQSKVIIINEGQFFDDIVPFTIELLKQKKIIFICGLDGDFERKKIGKLLDLIPLADKVEKLTALCAYCRDGTRGIFSKRITTETEQVVIGYDNYVPVCRMCYEK